MALVHRLSEQNPGFEVLVFQLCNLVSLYPPPFIYIHDTVNPRITSSVVKSILAAQVPSDSSSTHYAHVNAVACFNARLLFDSILNQLAGWEAKWEEGCDNWTTDGEKWNENVDGFCHGLKAVRVHLQRVETERRKKNEIESDKQKEVSVEAHHRMVVVIERAERLKETFPDMIAPLTRLAELVSPLLLLIVKAASRLLSDQVYHLRHRPRLKSPLYSSLMYDGKTFGPL